MPIDLKTYADAVSKARTTRTVTLPIIHEKVAKNFTNLDDIPTVTLTYAPDKYTVEMERKQTENKFFSLAWEMVLAMVVEWDLTLGTDNTGDPIPLPITEEGLAILDEELPEAIVSIALGMLDDMSEKKTLSSASRRRSRTPRR